MPGEVIVKFTDGALDAAELAREARSFGLDRSLVKDQNLRELLRSVKGRGLRRVVRKLRPHHVTSLARTGEEVRVPDLYNLMVLEVSEDVDVEALADSLEQVEGIAYAVPNYYLYAMGGSSLEATQTVIPFEPGYRPSASPLPALFSTTNDPRFADQRSFEQSTDKDIDAARAWDFTAGTSQVKVAVIDNGIDYDHPDLGNGAFGAGVKVSGGYDYYNNDSDPDDDGVGVILNPNYHGTKVAGIIGAYRNNGAGIAGLAGGDGQAGNIGVQLYALKTGIPNNEGTYNLDKVIEAICDAALSPASGGYGVHVINLSLGRSDYDAGIRKGLREALSVAAQNGVVVAAAAGNGGTSGSMTYPAAHDPSWVVAVGASSLNDTRLNTSSYGSSLDVVAPGDPLIVLTTEGGDANTFVPFENTSAATPHVAGLAALIKTIDLQRGLNLHPEDVEGIIKASADKVGGYAYNQDGWHEQMGHGRINAGKALEMLQSPYVLEQRTATGGTDQGITATASLRIYDAPGLTDGGFYYVEQREVRKVVTFSQRQKAYVWGRGANASTGWSNVMTDNELYGVGYTGVVAGSVTSASATLRTYVYGVYEVDALGRRFFQGYYPTTPANAVFAYTVLGAPPPPVSVAISGPSALVWKTSGTWTANPAGGTGSYTYRWYYRTGGTGAWTDTGVTTQSHTQSMTYSSGLELKVDVTSGSSTGSDTHFVTYCASAPCIEARTADIGAEVVQTQAIPGTYTLDQNYPNPFNPATEIRFALPEAGQVSLVIYDVMGRAVAQLVDGPMGSGYHEVDWDASELPSGVYLYRLQAGDFAQTRSMILQK